MKKIKSEGKCYYCDKTYSRTGMTKHLSSHLKEKDNLARKKSYHIKVTGGKLYFLHMLISENTTLEELDSYLRNIWVDCCGHLSSFEIKGTKRSMDYFMEAEEIGIKKTTKLGKLLHKDMILEYEYDFGSTTQLELKVINEYFVKDKRKIRLLSRNEPLEILCDSCGKKAAQVLCLMWHEKGAMFCDSCKEIHAEECSDFREYSEMDVVNSPRMGVCAYMGGSIDVKRDGAWSKVE